MTNGWTDGGGGGGGSVEVGSGGGHIRLVGRACVCLYDKLEIFLNASPSSTE